MKVTQDIKAGQELLVSFGKLWWSYYYRTDWNINPDEMPPLQCKVQQVYGIDESLRHSIFEGNSISFDISEKLYKFMDWNFGILNSVNNLINVGHSCFIAVIFQCISLIPALSRLLLETDIGKTLEENTFLSRFIKLLKLLIHKDEQLQETIQSQFEYFTDNREQINKSFTRNS